MLKQGNKKLLAFGILVLLLVSLIPVAAMAAPTQKIRDAVYDGSLWGAAEGKCGRITFDLDSWEYSLRSNKLEQVSGGYALSVRNSNRWDEGVYLLEGLDPNPHGFIRISGTIVESEHKNFIHSVIHQGEELIFTLTLD